MASRELQEPYLEREALRLILPSLRPHPRPRYPAGGFQYHYFHVDTAPVSVEFAVLTPFGFSQQVTHVE